MNLKERLLEIGMTYDELYNNCLPNEVFIKMDTTLYPEIKPDRYMISNKGRVYSIKTKKFLKLHLPANKDSDVMYYSVWLGNNKYHVHRLMMASFEHLGDIEKMRSLFVDHKDGNKLNNELYNLRWVTTQENTIYARDLGLLNPRKGETHPHANITNQQAHEICKLLECGKYSQVEIAKMFSIEEYVVFDILHRKSWLWISKDYDFENRKLSRLPKCFTFDQLHEICQYFQDNLKEEKISVRKHCINALKAINYDDNIITEGVINGVRSIYNKKRYNEITKEYVW